MVKKLKLSLILTVLTRILEVSVAGCVVLGIVSGRVPLLVPVAIQGLRVERVFVHYDDGV